MDYSSPLAAMHPPPVPAWGSRRHVPSSRLIYSNAHALAPTSFNFRDLSMHVRSSSDYFAARPHRASASGSSPTTTLAADLSSNFHIDQSPQVPTPRRALFVRDSFRPVDNTGLLSTPPVENEPATTPPIPESSPGMDAMDISPLPHKVPCFVANVILPSPTPDETPAPMAEILALHAAMNQAPGSPMDLSSPPAQVQMVLPERRKPAFQRPPLLRPKTYTTNTTIPSKEVLLPPFQFGRGAPKLSCASMPDLNGCAVESPLDVKPPTPTLLSSTSGLGAPLVASRRPSLSTVTKGLGSGSPGAGVVKRTSLAPQRPRKQVRRSLSMFQHPEDILRPADDYEPPMPPMQATPDMDMEYKHKLPHTLANEPDSLPRIEQDTLINVLNGQYSAHYDKVLVVDCRFEYEYNGGHIEGAVNYNDKEMLAKELFDGAAPPQRTLLILHCEYSVHRAPMTAKFLRNRDRAVNDFQYPRLTYPEMYVLDGGYSKFFKLHREKCFPQNYVEMEHKDHERACEKGMGKLKQRTKLGRAQTFAFGQTSCHIEESPTSSFGSRLAVRSYSTMDSCDISPIVGRSFNCDISPMARQFTRRLATA